MLTNNSSVPNIEGEIAHPPLSRTVCILLAVVMVITLIIGLMGNSLVLALFLNVLYNNMLTNNSSVPNTEGEIAHPSLSRTVCILLAVVMVITLMIGLIGNSLVLALFLKYKSLRTTSNIFMASLTVADLLMCVCHLPTLIHNYLREAVDQHIKELFCYYDTFVGGFVGFGAIWSLMALAIDRCVVISRSIPVRHSTDDVCAYFATVCIWLTALAFAVMPFIGFGQYVIEGSRVSCTFDYFSTSLSNILYNVLIQVLYFCVPITCMIICYGLIFLKVRIHERRYFSMRNGDNFDEASFRRIRRSRKMERNELKTAKASLILISVFCISWAPYSVVSWIGLSGDRHLLTPLVVVFPAVFAKISTVLNPLLYALLLRSFKVKLKLCCNQRFRPIRSSFASSERTHMEIIHYLPNEEQRRHIPVVQQ